MSFRPFLYSTLVNDSVLQGYVGDRIIQSSALRTASIEKPFICYHIGNETSEQLSETCLAGRNFFQVYTYDELGDYQLIDDINKRIKALLTGIGSPNDNITLIRYLEQSADMDDDVLRAIFRYLRFQVILGG